MNNIKYWMILSLAVVLFTTCKKVKKIDTIVEVDQFGNIISSDYNGDWSNDSKWNKKELDLFQIGDNIDLTGTKTGDVSFYPIYPNPVIDAFTIWITVDNPVYCKIIMVDKKYQVIHQFDYQISSEISFQINTGDIPNFTSGEYYRLYYAFYANENHLFYKGHGDFLID